MARKLFHWCMKNGAGILFGYAAICVALALILHGYHFAIFFWTEIGQPQEFGAADGEAQVIYNTMNNFVWVERLMLSALFPFLGAVAIYRFDKWNRGKEAAE